MSLCPPPAVALVPGFFGFDHRGDTTYFADRFVAGLRSVLEARGHLGIPVVSVSTLGIASLHRRQRDLLHELRALETPRHGEARLGGPRTWHLVGHSTGGLDAALLLRDAPLAQGDDRTTYAADGWGPDADLVARIASVTTLAAPHFGTGLAESPLARFAAGHPSLGALPDAVRGALALARRGDLGSRIRFALGATPPLQNVPWFLLQLTLMNELARDLRPEVAAALSARPVRASAEGRIASIATVAPRPDDDHGDKLFRDMWRWTHEGGRMHPHRSSAALEDRSHRLPSQRDLALEPVEAGDNDGVASTERQVLGELLAVVIGDHVDVLGRYRRTSLVDGKVIDPGLLTSGAEFGDDEFFGVLLRLGDWVARMVGAAA